MQKKSAFILIVPLIFISVILYFAFGAYNEHKYIEELGKHAKNASIRVTNIAEAEISGKLTYNEFFRRIDENIDDIEKDIFEIQANYPTDDAKAKNVVTYMRACQNFLRATSIKINKNISFSVASKYSDKIRHQFWTTPGLDHYLLEESNRASEEEKNAADEYLRSTYSAGNALQHLISSARNTSKIVGENARIDDTIISKLKIVDQTESEYKESREREQKKLEQKMLSLPPADMARKVGCYGCHDDKKMIVGPSFYAISKRYESHADAGEYLSNQILKGSSGVWKNYTPMPPAQVTEEEARKLAKWILSFGD